MRQRKVALGEVCSFFSGFAWKSKLFNKAGRGLPIIRIQNVSEEEVDFVYWNHPYYNRFVICEGDILLTLSGSFRIKIWNGPEALLNQRIVKITPGSHLTKEWLLHTIKSKLSQIEHMGKHALVNNVSLSDLREFKIPLPPRTEQKRIAAILDKADAIRKKRKKAIELTETFLRSAFLEMFGDPVTNPKGWEVTSLQKVCHKITDGTHQPPKWAESGIPFLFVSNIVNGRISFETKKYISEETWGDLTKRCPIELNDILYTTVGSYGNAALVETLDKFCFQRHIAHIKPNPELIHPLFLLGMMQSDGIRRQADEQVRGVAQKTLNLRELKEFKVLVPPLEMQLKYVKIRQRIVGAAQNQDKVSSLGNNLFNTFEQRAFRGKL